MNTSKNDILLILGLIILSTLPIFFNSYGDKKFAELKINDTIQQIDLSEDKIFEVDTGKGLNIIKVEDGSIAIIEADCPDKVCVKTGAIKNSGDVIACVPHNLLIKIASD